MIDESYPYLSISQFQNMSFSHFTPEVWAEVGRKFSSDNIFKIRIKIVHELKLFKTTQWL